jgi:hypothetical protein
MPLRYLLIVSRRELHDRLQKQFLDDSEVVVMVDRRHIHRRTVRRGESLPERRRANRRRNPDIDGRVATLGAAIVRADRANTELAARACGDEILEKAEDS